MDILVSVGASEFALDRLLAIVDDLCNEGIIDGNHVIAQAGSCNYTPKNFKAFKFISRDEYQVYMDKADVIISHAGTGCVVPAIKMGKKVLVFPRRKEYQEHLDNHQLELAEVFSANGYTKTVNNKDELKECLMNLDGFIPKPFISNKEKMNDLIIEYIESTFIK